MRNKWPYLFPEMVTEPITALAGIHADMLSILPPESAFVIRLLCADHQRNERRPIERPLPVSPLFPAHVILCYRKQSRESIGS